MKDKTLYIIAAVLALLALFGISQAKAEQIVFKNKCEGILPDSPDYWPCYDKSQGADNIERAAQWTIIKKRLKAAGYKIPAKVILNDPKCSKDECNYIGHIRGKALHLPILSGCLRLSTVAAFRAYGNHRSKWE